MSCCDVMFAYKHTAISNDYIFENYFFHCQKLSKHLRLKKECNELHFQNSNVEKKEIGRRRVLK